MVSVLAQQRGSPATSRLPKKESHAVLITPSEITNPHCFAPAWGNLSKSPLDSTKISSGKAQGGSFNRISQLYRAVNFAQKCDGTSQEPRESGISNYAKVDVANSRGRQRAQGHHEFDRQAVDKMIKAGQALILAIENPHIQTEEPLWSIHDLQSQGWDIRRRQKPWTRCELSKVIWKLPLHRWESGKKADLRLMHIIACRLV